MTICQSISWASCHPGALVLMPSHFNTLPNPTNARGVVDFCPFLVWELVSTPKKFCPPLTLPGLHIIILLVAECHIVVVFLMFLLLLLKGLMRINLNCCNICDNFPIVVCSENSFYALDVGTFFCFGCWYLIAGCLLLLLLSLVGCRFNFWEMCNLTHD